MDIRPIKPPVFFTVFKDKDRYLDFFEKEVTYFYPTGEEEMIETLTDYKESELYGLYKRYPDRSNKLLGVTRSKLAFDRVYNELLNNCNEKIVQCTVDVILVKP